MPNHNPTKREQQVLELLAEGLTYRQIGAQLGCNWRTVSTHAHMVYDKLGVGSRTEAINLARQQGLLPTPNLKLEPIRQQMERVAHELRTLRLLINRMESEP